MPPQAQGIADATGHLAQIGRAVPLRRHRGHICHIKILFPAHNGAVRSSEGQVGCAIRQKKSHGRELFLLLGAENIDIKAHLDLSKAGAPGKSACQFHVLLGSAGPPRRLQALLPGKKFPQGPHWRLIKTAHNPVELKIGGLGQHQAVHLTKAPSGKGHFLLQDIINDISHEVPFSISVPGHDIARIFLS